jgi:hypothetical protein
MMTANANRVSKSRCPTCNEVLDAATRSDGGDAMPSAGDYSVCFYCGSFLTFLPDMQLRLLSVEEVAALDDETRIAMVRAREVTTRTR